MPVTAPRVRATAMLACLAAIAQAAPPAHSPAMDRDLLEVTLPQLQRYYAEHRYTIAQVVDWPLEFHPASVPKNLRACPRTPSLILSYTRSGNACGSRFSIRSSTAEADSTSDCIRFQTSGAAVCFASS